MNIAQHNTQVLKDVWPGPLDPLVMATKEGLQLQQKALPPWMFYDARGSDLFEQITRLPEYYLSRAERQILEDRSDEIVAAAALGSSAPLKVVELGAGSATKTQWLLDAVVRRQGHCLYLPIDVSSAALKGATARLRRELPAVEVQPFAGTHMAALPAIRNMGARRLVLFVGSSVGNYSDQEAVDLLAAVARQLQPGAGLLLGTDRLKDVETMRRAYDDAAGVTAAFNLNVLVRLNRELGANFDLRGFRHEARWNEAHCRVEMHLVSTHAQRVLIPALGQFVFRAGESIHTECSTKYGQAHVDRILHAAGFCPVKRFSDAQGLFDLHLARRTDAAV